MTQTLTERLNLFDPVVDLVYESEETALFGQKLDVFYQMEVTFETTRVYEVHNYSKSGRIHLKENAIN